MARILIIENDRHLGAGMRDILELESYQVLTAENGAEGLKSLETTLPDLILCNLMMPVMNGYEFLEALRANPKWQYIRIIFMGGKGAGWGSLGMPAQRNNFFLTKPFGADDLLSIVAEGLKRPSPPAPPPANMDEIINIIRYWLNSGLRSSLTMLLGTADLQEDNDQTLSQADLRVIAQGYKDLAERSLIQIRHFNLLLEIAAGEVRRSWEKQRYATQAYQEIITDALQPLERLAQQKNCPLQVEIEEALPAIMTTPHYLSAALSPLIDNAIKFSDPDGLIQIQVKKEAASVLFIVQDQGRGIPEDELKNLFTPRFLPYNDKNQGLGLGLLLAKGIAEALGAEVTVTSELGKGSRFCLRFPS